MAEAREIQGRPGTRLLCDRLMLLPAPRIHVSVPNQAAVPVNGPLIHTSWWHTCLIDDPYPFTHRWTLDLLPRFSYCEYNAALNTDVLISQDPAFNYCGCCNLFIMFDYWTMWMYYWKLYLNFLNWKENLMIGFGPLKCQFFKDSKHSTCANASVERTWILECNTFWFQCQNLLAI